jgi:hypothetical protein
VKQAVKRPRPINEMGFIKAKAQKKKEKIRKKFYKKWQRPRKNC